MTTEEIEEEITNLITQIQGLKENINVVIRDWVGKHQSALANTRGFLYQLDEGVIGIKKGKWPNQKKRTWMFYYQGDKKDEITSMGDWSVDLNLLFSDNLHAITVSIRDNLTTTLDNYRTLVNDVEQTFKVIKDE